MKIVTKYSIIIIFYIVFIKSNINCYNPGGGSQSSSHSFLEFSILNKNEKCISILLKFN